MVKIECEVCHQVGYLQQLGNYFRVRHYAGIDKNTGKARFYYHQQTKEYAESQLAGMEKEENLQQSNSIDQLNNHEHLNLSNSSLISSGRSLVWLGHQPPTLTTRVQIPATAPNPKTLSEGPAPSLINRLNINVEHSFNFW
jgi:hypothetical protein